MLWKIFHMYGVLDIKNLNVKKATTNSELLHKSTIEQIAEYHVHDITMYTSSKFSFCLIWLCTNTKTFAKPFLVVDQSEYPKMS